MIVAGFGFRASAEVSSLRDALAATGAVPTLVATASGKEAHPALMALATELNVPVVGVSEEKMAEQITPTHSAASAAAYNTGSVAEAAALFAAGRGAVLERSRCISTDRLATCAIAKGDPA